MDRKLLALATIACMPSLCAVAAEPSLSVTGIVAHPLHLSLAELRNFPITHVMTTQTSGNGPVALDCNGVAVSVLLERAAPSFGTGKNIALAHTILFTADDGYAVALSFGEIDPDYGHAAPVIATDCYGKPVDAPRLVVPGDAHAGRAMRGVITMEVK